MEAITVWKASGLAAPARRIRWVLFGVMSLASAAVIAMATVTSIVAAELGSGARWAGVPTAMVLIGSSLSAPAWGAASDRIGRRGVVALGLLLGVAGAAVAGWAVVSGLAVAFSLGLLLTGTTSAAVQLSRFAAGEVHPAGLRARAISTVVLGGAVGSIVGPLLVAPTGELASGLGRNELAGPFAAATVLFAVGAVGVFVLLRPDPRDLGRRVAGLIRVETAPESSSRTLVEILRTRPAFLAVTAMVLGQMVMMMVMVMTSLHMRSHDHDLGSISLVIAAHTFGMYAFSVVSGRLADRHGRTSIIAIGSGLLILACLAAPLSPEVLPLAVSLFLLGLGWNFCYVAGSALLSDQLRPPERARTQGVNDLMIGAASAVGSLGSGIVFAVAGYAAMAVFGAFVAVIPLILALVWRRSDIAGSPVS